MTYRKAVQARAIATERRFLDALNECLTFQSYESTSIEQISKQAGLHRGAFLKRFGSKREALLVLFSRYCDRASATIQTMQRNLHEYPTAESICFAMSVRLEEIQLADFGANRAMLEDFSQKLETDQLTKRIFSETVELMRSIQSYFLKDIPFTDQGAFAASQLLVTLNFNYVMNAMPGLPRSAVLRHKLISQCLYSALVN